MSGHTPGPWSAGKYNGRPVVYWDKGNGTVPIASFYDIASEGSAEANARLIAAAPELLAACRTALVGAYDVAGSCECLRWSVLAETLRAAIAKAEGRGE